MKKTMLEINLATAAVWGSLALAACAQTAQPPSTSDPLLNLLLKKGILTDQEAQAIKSEAALQTNTPSASKWKISAGIKSIELYGDMRFRYEYRGFTTVAGNPANGETGARERFRYALRLGLRGDLYDNFYYGLRLETSTNPRSTWVTFGGEKTYNSSGPSGKADDGFNVGQAFLGWRPTDWLDLTVGKMPNPLYTTSLVWDPDIAPEGAAEKFKRSFGNVDVFATFGQFLYTDTDPDRAVAPYMLNSPGASGTNTSDAFLLAWQVGANVHLNKDMSFKLAPTLYSYTRTGQNAGFPGPFVGEGNAPFDRNSVPIPGWNNPDTTTTGINQSGINNLLIFQTPAEFNFTLGRFKARLFGDFAINLDGEARANAAYQATLPSHGFTGLHPLTRAYGDDTKAYQLGVGVGNLGLVTGQTSKKGTWELRAYWQHVEQYALDVNLIDSDFMEGRANLEGFYAAAAYSFTDSIIGTVRYGHATKINQGLGTGGSNQDLPSVNPINAYNLVQLDLTWRF